MCTQQEEQKLQRKNLKRSYLQYSFQSKLKEFLELKFSELKLELRILEVTVILEGAVIQDSKWFVYIPFSKFSLFLTVLYHNIFMLKYIA